MPSRSKEAEDSEQGFKSNVIYIAPGGFHMTVRRNGIKGIEINVTTEPKTTLHRPAVDVMMNSVIDVYGKHTLGVIMTSMGKDGFEAIKNLKALVVTRLHRMKKAVLFMECPKLLLMGLADLVLPLENPESN